MAKKSEKKQAEQAAPKAPSTIEEFMANFHKQHAALPKAERERVERQAYERSKREV